MYSQSRLTLAPHARGSHLITTWIETELGGQLSGYGIGLVHLFIQHTSAALSLNENCDVDVREDMSAALDRLVPEEEEEEEEDNDRQGEGKRLYRHADEGPDDMPAHVKSSLIGSGVTIPITDGRLALGTWQGIWYLEFRDGARSRTVVATIHGEPVAG